MKIELIDETRIKVILSCYDILELNFDVSSLSPTTKSARKFIKDILKRAEEDFSFVADMDKIMVESIPSQKDGYIIYITKAENSYTGGLIFSFIDFKALKSAVNTISDAFYGNSNLFLMESKYYLVFNCGIEGNLKKTEIKLTDFGEKILNSVIVEGVLNEYGRLIYKKNAIKIIKNQKN